ncbi:hypothetical protein BVC80_9047g30 [Macleaya cordata]|uniref:Uncharacterized protein n=1 Tax=Macleaya cordata TaxID=56857 RepID=A0A200R331_MACCD|nr:hypothetical protein BVC80_9047g30 [Macleaya cordata]
MDLGCLDLGCLDLGCNPVTEKQSNESSSVDLQKKSGDCEESVMATTKFGKTKVSKETGQSTLNAVNKSTSQIRKPNRKGSSPLNWFPRKKTESYLKRKIRLLQEVGGMNSTLDETLCDSSPHYSRVLREKIAAREAAHKAMEARKAALVEASWCRILRAARIQSKEAELLLLKVEKNVEEAFEAATAMGVIMYDRPDCPQKAVEIESSSVNIGGTPTHTVTASFETAFDVDKQVAAAVKTACIRLANCPSSLNKDEFRDLLRKINQNPVISEADQELSEFSSECESDTGTELESEFQRDGSASEGSNNKMLDTGLRQRKCKDKGSPDIKFVKLVDMMLERLKCLQDNELASLATIVATCGLNAVLVEVENSKLSDPATMKYSNMESFKGQNMRKQVTTELPSLDKFLVKHMSRLEREVQEAKNTRKNEVEEGSGENQKGSENRVDHLNSNPTLLDTVPGLGSILVKHASNLEKEIQKAKSKSGIAFENEHEQLKNKKDVTELPSLDKFLVKHVSRLEREVQEAQNKRKGKPREVSKENKEGSVDRVDMNSNVTLSEATPGLGSILLKHSSKLEKEIAQAKKTSGEEFEEVNKKLRDKQHEPEVPSLDKCLVKHVSRLEREVQEAKSTRKTDPVETNTTANFDGVMDSSQDIANTSDMVNSSCINEKQVDKENIDSNTQGDGVKDETVKEKLEIENTEQSLVTKNMSRIERARLETLEAFSCQDGKNYSSLDKVLVKPVHRLEREKMQALALGRGYGIQKDQKKQGGTDVSDCESLDKVLVKHISRLEKEKIGLGKKEELVKVERRDLHNEKSVDGLDQILVKHQSRLEKEKLAFSQHLGDQIKPIESRREAMQRELQESWGGLSLGNSIRPHVSRLEREKAAWIKAEEEEQIQGRIE